MVLKENLLLDSARPFSDEIQTDPVGCRKNISAGVPSSCPELTGTMWHVLRVSYSRELKIKNMLDERGLPTFVPMEWRKLEKDGKTDRVLVPAVNNLCFVKAEREQLDDFIRSFGESSPVHLYWDRTASRPLTVRDKVMDDFIKVSSAIDKDIVYLKEIAPKLREGQDVKVKSGPFAGIEGKIVRIRKSRRIMVELPGMLAVATTYVSPLDLELV